VVQFAAAVVLVALAATEFNLPLKYAVILDDIKGDGENAKLLSEMRGWPIVRCNGWINPSRKSIENEIEIQEQLAIEFGDVPLRINVPVRHRPNTFPLSRGVDQVQACNITPGALRDVTVFLAAT
jgi:hypothetical protein